MNEMMVLILGTVGATGLGATAYHLKRIWSAPDQISDMREDLSYVRSRLDAVYDHLIGIGSHKR